MAKTSSKLTFQLDLTAAGREILQQMAMPVVLQAGRQIQARAASMAASQSKNPPAFQLASRVGTIKRGQRAIATVSAPTNDPRESYLAHTALAKAKDAGRLN